MSGSTRVASIRLSTEDLDAARAKMEALGSLGDQVLERITQAGHRATAAVAGIADGGDVYTRRAADIAAYGVELDRLRGKFDPLFAASKRYEATLEEIAYAERVGAINAGVAARARDATTKAFADAVAPTGVAAATTAVLAGKTAEAAQQHENLTISAGASAFALRQLGVQTMQAVSSIAAGQPVMMTMIQQGHQVADVAISTGTGFGILGTAARMVAGALLSPIGAAVAVGGAFALAMVHASALETEARQLSVALRAVGRDGDLATASLQGYIVTLQHAGVARDAAASIVQGLARVPALGNAQIQQVVGLTADTTAAVGSTDQAAVAKRLGEIASGIGPGEQIVLAAQRYGAHRILGHVVVRLQPSVGDEARHGLAPCDGVSERFGKFELARQLGQSLPSPVEERVQQRCGLAAVLDPFGSGREPCLVLDSIDCGDPVQCFPCDRRLRGLPHVVEFATAMRPAGDFDYRTRRGPGRMIQGVEPGITVSLKEAGEAGHMRRRMCGAAIWAVEVGGRRGRRTSEQPVVAHIGP